MRTKTISSLSPEYQELKKLFPSLGQKEKPQPKTDPVPSKPVDGPALLHDLARFIGVYLYCSEYQRHLLALWALHTWCASAIKLTPYLAILSPQPEAGKTLCLQLLSLLCQNPSLTSTLTTPALIDRMRLSPPSAILLDDAQSILGTRTRSKNPVLRSLLANGSHFGHGTLDLTQDYHVFCPKAFALTGLLPDDLAYHSIPIVLQPLPRREGRWFSPNGIQRFDSSHAEQEAKSLKQRLSAWSQQHRKQLQQLPAYGEEQFPQCLSPLNPRRMQLIEPLLQLADVVAGPWPGHIRQALDVLFDEGDHFHLFANRQLLEDIYLCFSTQRYPDRLTSSFLLNWLHSRQNRSWQAEGPINAHRLAQLLGVFEINPRVHRMSPSQTARGYQLADFQPAWLRHMGIEIRRAPDGNFYPILSSSLETMNGGVSPFSPPVADGPLGKREPALAGESVTEEPGSPTSGSPTHAGFACGGVAVRAGFSRDGVEEPSKVTSEKSEIANVYGVCYGVTQEPSKVTSQTETAGNGAAGRPAVAGYGVTPSDAAPISGRQNGAVAATIRDQSVENMAIPQPPSTSSTLAQK